MSYSRYLTAINTILRQTVLPEVQSGGAKDAVNNSIRVLGAIAANLERVAPEVLEALDVATLPSSLLALVPTSTVPVEALDTSMTLPLSGPADDFALNNDALPMLKAGAAWLATQPWPDDAALKQSALALLAWETTMRSDSMARVRKSELGFIEVSSSAAVADLNQAALEKYLRNRLETNKVRITEFRFLSGGRNRQTALFCVEGTTEIPARLVIQREPPTAMTTLSSIGMQYAVLQQAHAAGMKVARPIMLELSAESLGASFMIAEQVGGTSPVPSMDYWSPPLKSDRIAVSLAKQFALMHRIPLDKLEGVMERYVDTSKGQTWLSDTNALEQQWLRIYP